MIIITLLHLFTSELKVLLQPLVRELQLCPSTQIYKTLPITFMDQEDLRVRIKNFNILFGVDKTPIKKRVNVFETDLSGHNLLA